MRSEHLESELITQAKRIDSLERTAERQSDAIMEYQADVIALNACLRDLDDGLRAAHPV